MLIIRLRIFCAYVPGTYTNLKCRFRVENFQIWGTSYTMPKNLQRLHILEKMLQEFRVVFIKKQKKQTVLRGNAFSSN